MSAAGSLHGGPTAKGRAHTRWVIVMAVTAILVLAWSGVAFAQDTTGQNTVAGPQPGDPPCVACHAYVSNDVVSSWRSQNHGRARVACPVCHGTHDKAFRPNPKAAVCAGCHDLARIHPDLSATLPARRCMDCHTANVHLLPGQESWFQGGLPLSKLSAPAASSGGVSAAAARSAALVVLVLAILFGLIVGLVYVRLARKL